MGFLFKAADTFFALRFLRLLTTPWKKTGAFKAGTINDKGEVIKKPTTAKERETYNLFHKLVFNIKRLLNKLPFGKSTIASYASALYLIKEHTGLSEELLGELLQESLGYNPLDDIDETLPTLLDEGIYTCDRSFLFENGDLLNISRSPLLIFNENDCESIGSIFNMPIFKAKVDWSDQYVLVTNENITKIKQ